MIQWPYKLIAGVDCGSPELYELVADPRETNELGRSKPKLVEALCEPLQERFEREASRGGVGQAGKIEQVELDDETFERFRALGYMD